MSGSYALGDDGFGGKSGDTRSRRLRLGYPDDEGGRSQLGGDRYHCKGDGGQGNKHNHLCYGSEDVDPRHYGRHTEYGNESYGHRRVSCLDDPRYGGRQAKLHDSLVLPEEESSYGDSLDSSASSFKTPPPSSPSPEDCHLGVQFGSAMDAVSAKIAAFDGKGPVVLPSIEIAPGMTARLRGAKETWEAVENDFYAPATCMCCQTDLFCIMDANYVLCPSCKVISPLEGGAQGGAMDGGAMDGGVGLGFTCDDLQRWQYEIVLRRQRSGW